MGQNMFDDSREWTKHIGRTALILLLIYIMVIGLIRVRNQSILDSMITFVDDEGTFTRDSSLIYQFTLTEASEVELRITLDYERVNNDTQLVVQLVTWDNTIYDSWAEAKEKESMIVGSSIVVLTPPMGLRVNQTELIQIYDLTDGAWVLSLSPYTEIDYKVLLVTIP